eukprot:maker-scaffold_16-snap-gene-6.18-mRNA-1 protein AED:0.06 eAED:0.06 QI:0/0.5/0/1/1/1/3/0/762
MKNRVFFQGLSLCYFFGFSSLYVQWPGLFGYDGIYPAGEVLPGPAESLYIFKERGVIREREISKENYTTFQRIGEILQNIKPRMSDGSKNFLNEFISCYLQKPTLGCISRTSAVPLHEDVAFQIIALLGAVLALLFSMDFIIPRVLQTPCLWFLWLGYLSLQTVGRTFLSFQWDNMLLEVGFLAAIHSTMRNNMSKYLLCVTLFKLMFMSGAVKLLSECPTWWSLTALDYHFVTQPLPSPLSWVAQQLSRPVKRALVAGTLFAEIPLAFFILSPYKSHRLVAFIVQSGLQVGILLTGNYAFFNLLTIVCCLPLLETLRLSSVYESMMSTCCKQKRRNGYFMLFSLGFAVLTFGQMFEIIWDEDRQSFPIKTTSSLRKAFSSDLGYVLFGTWLLLLALSAYHFQADFAYYKRKHLNFKSERKISAKRFFGVMSFMTKFFSLVGMFFLLQILMLPIFSLNQDLLSRLHMTLYKVTSYNWVGNYNRALPYQISHQYGLFRAMTGVGVNGGQYPSIPTRPELHFSALLRSSSGIESWDPIDFYYKPNHPDNYHDYPKGSYPKFVAPHQPRLDWQLWFVSQRDMYQNSAWIIQFSQKVLEGSQDVLDLVQPIGHTFPFNTYKIIAVKADRLYLDFTRESEKLTSDEKYYYLNKDDSTHPSIYYFEVGDENATKYIRDEYLPPVKKGDPAVVEFLRFNGFNAVTQKTREQFKETRCGSEKDRVAFFRYHWFCNILDSWKGKNMDFWWFAKRILALLTTKVMFVLWLQE